jgi:hypothetical protein
LTPAAELRAAPLTCIRCGYTLDNLESDLCPECAYPVADSRSARLLLRFAPADAVRAIHRGVSAARFALLTLLPMGLLFGWLAAVGVALTTFRLPVHLIPSRAVLEWSVVCTIGAHWLLNLWAAVSIAHANVEGLLPSSLRTRLVITTLMYGPLSLGALVVARQAFPLGIHPFATLGAIVLGTAALVTFAKTLTSTLRAVATRTAGADPDTVRFAIGTIAVVLTAMTGWRAFAGQQPHLWSILALYIVMLFRFRAFGRLLKAVRAEAAARVGADA